MDNGVNGGRLFGNVRIGPALGALTMLVLGCSPLTAREAGVEEDIRQVASTTLRETVITAHLEEPIPAGKNVIYCATFQLAWNELRDSVIGEDVRLMNEPPMVPVLNRKLVTKDMLSEDSYVAMAGFATDNLLRQINNDLATKFGGQAPIVTREGLAPGDILAYGFLLKDLKFNPPFEDLRETLRFNSDGEEVPVAAFGIKEFYENQHSKLGEQVSVLCYDSSQREFVIQLATDSEKDELILAKVTPKETLLRTIRAVQERIQGGIPGMLGYEDTLQIPKVDFNISHSYAQLIGKGFLNEGFAMAHIEKAGQDIRFRLNERGVKITSGAVIWARAAPRRLVFDGPFLIWLRHTGQNMPYLAIWISNSELLVPS